MDQRVPERCFIPRGQAPPDGKLLTGAAGTGRSDGGEQRVLGRSPPGHAGEQPLSRRRHSGGA